MPSKKQTSSPAENGRPTTLGGQEDEDGQGTSTASAADHRHPPEPTAAAAAAAATAAATDVVLDPLKLSEVSRYMARLQLADQTAVRTFEEAKSRNYAFWSTQPVPKFDEKVEENTFIEPNLPLDQVRSEPYSLPDGFVWSEVDLHDEEQLRQLYTLLTENYVEDDDNMFRFDYSPGFLRWALLVPGWLPKWHLGVRVKTNQRLIGFIAAIPQHVNVYDKTVKMVEINYLCVLKKLRSKRVAPVLIREITRRVNQEGIFQAAFTAGIVIPKPVAVCRYWHRSLNPRKLIEVKFSHLARNMNMQRTTKLYKLPDNPHHALRPLEQRDIPSARRLLASYLARFKLSPHFVSDDEFGHLFLPRTDVIYTYVLVDEKSGEITDFLSFYSLPSSVMQHPAHSSIRAAYSYYNVSTTMSLKDLLQDALILANKENFDVFNALDLMENAGVLSDLKFGIGDGNLQYYLYNWKCPEMTPKDVALVLQ